MAFIRQYTARSAAGNYVGDPFSLRMPKKIRKLKVGRALGKGLKALAPLAAMALPGVGGIAAQLAAGIGSGGGGGSIAQQLMAPEPEPEVYQEPALPSWLQMLMAYSPELGSFARSYGMDMAGDPGKGGSRRKRAGAGPATKAAAKKDKRATKAIATKAKVKGSSARGKQGGGLGSALGHIGNIGLGALKDIPGLGGAIAAGQDEFSFGGFGKGGKVPSLFGHKRRSMNPANVKALRRSLRRVEGFEKIVKRIEKQYPRLKRAVGHSAPVHRGKRRVA